MKVFKKIIIVLAFILIAANIALSFLFYNLTVARTKKNFLAGNPTLTASVPASAKATTCSVATGSIDWFNEKTYEQVNITSYDGLKLNGYFLKAQQPSSRTVILAHGYSSQGTYMGPYAKLYYEMGYNVLMPDSRGHGKSEGDSIGFGWIDRLDYLKWIDYLIKRLGQNTQIVLHGVSMGGDTVLMTSGENLPQNVKAVVSDSAYTSVKDELQYQLNVMYHLPYFPLLATTSILTKIRAGYFFEEASAIEQVKKSNTPTLFIHGEADEFVPFSMVNQLYNAESSEKDLLTVPNAGHGMAYSVDPVGYKNKVQSFLSKYVK